MLGLRHGDVGAARSSPPGIRRRSDAHAGPDGDDPVDLNGSLTELMGASRDRTS
jgi:hypothetical protein